MQLWIGWFGPLAAGAVVVEGAAEPTSELVQHQEVKLALTDADGQPRSGETVRVIHRPGIAGESELAIGISDGRGRVRWTPQVAGVATVRAGDETLSVRIEPAEPPVASIVTLTLVALGAGGALAFGAFGASLRGRLGRPGAR